MRSIRVFSHSKVKMRKGAIGGLRSGSDCRIGAFSTAQERELPIQITIKNIAYCALLASAERLFGSLFSPLGPLLHCAANRRELMSQVLKDNDSAAGPMSTFMPMNIDAHPL